MGFSLGLSRLLVSGLSLKAVGFWCGLERTITRVSRIGIDCAGQNSAIMESEKQEGMQILQEQGGDILSASSYQEQELRHTNSIGDKGRDESTQAGDFLRGSRGDEPSSALMHILQDHHHHSHHEKTQSNSKASAAAAGDKSGDAVETVEGKPWDVAGDAANGKGVDQESSSHRLPHQEVPQPGQYTDMDAVVEFVALADV